MPTQTAAQLLVKCLLNQGVTTGFGVPGESYLNVLDALYDVSNEFQFITCRQEGGVGFMAEAYGKLTGQPGIAFVTRGPGATNASIGVHTAMQNSSPMILFVGQIGRHMTDREAFQEVDYRAFFGTITKWVTQIDDPDRVPELISRAFSTALSGRPGPVVVALPEDMLRETTDALPCEKVQIARPSASQTQLSEILKRVQSAKRPVILAGGGGWTDKGRDNLRSFAEALDIPVLCGFRSNDVIDNSSDVFIGDGGFGKTDAVKRLLTETDLLFAINIRFGEVVTDGWSLFDFPKPDYQMIHAHASAEELNKVYQADLPIVACPNQLMTDLDNLKGSGTISAWRKDAKAETVKTSLPFTIGPVNPAEICDYINQHADPDMIATSGAGNYAIWPGRFLKFNKHRRFVAPQSGAMGAGLTGAIACKAAYPTRQVIAFTGDGDFQMNMQEMASAHQAGLCPIVIIQNNSSYGTIRMHQEGRFKDRVSGTDLVNPDFGGLSKAFGFEYHKVTETDQFPAAFDAATKAPNGCVIELVVDVRDIAPGKTL